MIDSRDVVFVCKPRAHKDDCAFKAGSEYEAKKLRRFMVEMGCPHEIVLISVTALGELPLRRD